MRYFSVNSGQYPKYDNIQLKIFKNQNTMILFDWNSIFRSWHFVPKITDFKFRLSLIIDSKLKMDDNVLAIMSSDLGEITIDEETEMIMCKLNLVNTRDLRVYDGGMFSFDYAKLPELTDRNFMNQYADNYYRLCSGRWTVDENTMLLDTANYNQISSYMNYNEVGNDEIVTSFKYEVVD